MTRGVRLPCMTVPEVREVCRLGEDSRGRFSGRVLVKEFKVGFAGKLSRWESDASEEEEDHVGGEGDAGMKLLTGWHIYLR